MFSYVEYMMETTILPCSFLLLLRSRLDIRKPIRFLGASYPALPHQLFLAEVKCGEGKWALLENQPLVSNGLSRLEA